MVEHCVWGRSWVPYSPEKAGQIKRFGSYVIVKAVTGYVESIRPACVLVTPISEILWRTIQA